MGLGKGKGKGGKGLNDSDSDEDSYSDEDEDEALSTDKEDGPCKGKGKDGFEGKGYGKEADSFEGKGYGKGYGFEGKGFEGKGYGKGNDSSGRFEESDTDSHADSSESETPIEWRPPYRKASNAAKVMASKAKGMPMAKVQAKAKTAFKPMPKKMALELGRFDDEF